MPLVQVSMRKGQLAEYKKTVLDSIYTAMRETFNVPENDRFMTISEHDEDCFVYDDNYLNIKRTDHLLIIRITANNTRTVEQKKALYQKIAELLNENLNIRPEDVFINLVEVPKENWSFGSGIGQYI